MTDKPPERIWVDVSRLIPGSALAVWARHADHRLSGQPDISEEYIHISEYNKLQTAFDAAMDALRTIDRTSTGIKRWLTAEPGKYGAPPKAVPSSSSAHSIFDESEGV